MKLKTLIFAVAAMLFLPIGVWAAPKTADDAKQVTVDWLKRDPRPLGETLGQRVKEVQTFRSSTSRCRSRSMAIADGYRKQVALLIRTIPFVATEHEFALKGGTAINLFVRDMPRLSRSEERRVGK